MPGFRVAAAVALLGVTAVAAACPSGTPTYPPTSTASPAPTALPVPTSAASVEPTDLAIDRMEQVLTGTIERAGSCTVLVVGDRRLPLLAADSLGADSLVAGTRVTVRGSPVAMPPACGGIEAGQALRVTTVLATQGHSVEDR